MALWTPADLTVPPLHWFKGDAGITGSPVIAWENQNASSPDLIQGDASSRPSTGAVLNALPVLTFDGIGPDPGGDYLTSSGTLNYSANTHLYYFSVALRDSDSDSYDSMMFIGPFWDPNNGVVVQWTGDGGNKLHVYGRGYGGNAPECDTAVAPAAATDDQWHIIEAGIDSTPNISIDGTALALGVNRTGTNVPAMNSALLQIGANDGANNPYDNYKGKKAEEIVLNYRPVAADIARIQGYLAWKWGNTGSAVTNLVAKLPSGHAYKTAAPVTGGGTPGSKEKVWNGTAWVEKPVKIWTGSAWVAKPLNARRSTDWY